MDSHWADLMCDFNLWSGLCLSGQNMQHFHNNNNNKNKKWLPIWFHVDFKQADLMWHFNLQSRLSKRSKCINFWSWKVGRDFRTLWVELKFKWVALVRNRAQTKQSQVSVRARLLQLYNSLPLQLQNSCVTYHTTWTTQPIQPQARTNAHNQHQHKCSGSHMALFRKIRHIFRRD